MPFDLDAANSSHVTGHSVLDADLGIGGRRLVVISGIAIPAWQIDSDELHRAECRLNLRVQSDHLEQSTVYVGLASIGNDDSEWTFATDTARLETAPNGDLILVTNLALLGETSDIHRFSYQVVLTKRVVVSEISGKITWPNYIFRPTGVGPSAVAGNFTIAANYRESTTTPGAFGSITTESLTSAAPGEIVQLTIGDDTCEALYRIANPPKGRELKVTIKVHGVNPPAGYEADCDVVAVGRNIFTLTPLDAVRKDVDFVVTLIEEQG